MNDPGLDKPIEQDAKAIEDRASSQSDGPDADDVEDEQAYLEPSRWWFASTAFPLLAGTFGPMASAFNICAIASHWRTSLAPSEAQNAGADIPDPEWLLAINGVSLVFAITANLALLFNMARRVPFSVAQPVTIVGWYIAAFILIGLAASVNAPSMQVSTSDNVVLTQAFFYCCLAAGLYILVASFMVVTVVGAYRGHYSKDFQLTLSQRTLMLQTISYLVYLLAGGAIFAHIEGWLFLDGVWWANYTLLTIGIGDFSPITHTGQSLLFPFAIGGIVILGLVVGSIRSLVLERGEKKIAARIVEKKREKVIDHLDGKEGETKIRLGIFSHHHLRIKKDKKEYARRAEEFKLMRRIQEYADARKKWTALLISALSWLSLWLVGAAVFYVAERNVQDITYFEMIYFAYTSLLTIGYGDYTMESNAGKPIFVFWSLLAIPTLTILISNMGDTVVKGVRDLTLRFGELTILPGEGSTKDKLAKGAEAIKQGKIKDYVQHKHHNRSEDDVTAEPPGGVFLAEEHRRGAGHAQKANLTPAVAAADRLGKEYEAEELEAATEAGQQGDKLSADVHLYHYLLVREIRNVMKDVNEQPPKKYSYHEWAWFMRLLGEDERNPEYHTKPTALKQSEKGNEDDAKHMQKGDQDENQNGQGTQVAQDGSTTQAGQSAPWSWVGINSPLLGTDEEAEWVLERLSEKLEEELKNQSARRRRGQRAQTPPVTQGSRETQQRADGEDEDEDKDDDHDKGASKEESKEKRKKDE